MDKINSHKNRYYMNLSRNVFYRNLLMCIMQLAVVLNIHAGVETYTSPRAKGAALVNGVNIEDGKYQFMKTQSWESLFFNKKITNRVVLGIDVANTHVFTQTTFTVSVEIEVTYQKSTGGNTFVPVTVTPNPVLTLTYNTASTKFDDKVIYQIPDGGNAVSVIVKTVTPSSFAFADYNMYLEAQVEVERYAAFNINTVPTISSASSLNAKNEIEVSWDVIPGAEEYDLEWVHVNDYEGTYTSTDGFIARSAATSDLDEIKLDERQFQFHSTRISTKNNFFNIPYIYDRGYVLYRVRGQGRVSADNYATNIPGVWSVEITSATDMAAFTTTNTTSYFPVSASTVAHNDDLNWQKSISFAEDGKNKVAVNYFDGSLRNRQTVSKINSTDKVIVGETIYDHQGRGAVQVLPVPINTGTIEFQEKFNLVNGSVGGSGAITTGLPYNRNHFDIDNGGTCVAAPLGMDTGRGTISSAYVPGGASHYYSPGNFYKNEWQAFLPDARLYPFTQIEYTPDNTGRIRRQSGVGADHVLGSDHETEYFYSKPSQEELDRLFGTEVGDAVHYKKNVVRDANRQVSTSFLDPQGRVIATALSGDAPENVDPLSSPTGTMTEDILNKNPNNTQGSENKIDLPTRSLTVSKTFTSEKDDPRDFTYQMDGAQYTENCTIEVTHGGTTVSRGPYTTCFDCVLDLEISLTDECGTEYLKGLAASGATSTVVGQSILNGIDANPETYDPSCGTTPPQVASTTVHTNNGTSTAAIPLPVGSYNLEKKLVVNQKALDFYTKKYLANTSNCILTLEDFTTEELAAIDFAACNIDCDVCDDKFKADYDAYVAAGNDHSLTLQQYTDLKAICKESCDEKSVRCEAKLQALLADVSIQGQYGQIMPGGTLSSGGVVDPQTSSVDPSKFWASVFNSGNYLPRKSTIVADFTANLSSSLNPYYNNIIPGAIVPDWRHPYNSISSNRFSYVKTDGSIDYVTLHKDPAGNWSPAVLSTLTSRIVNIDLVTGTAQVEAQFLQNFNDFLAVWKSEYAYSLVHYHPEYVYYEFCVIMATSNDFDDKWLTIDKYNDIVSSTNGFGSGAITGPLSVDPFFSGTSSSTVNPFFTSTTDPADYVALSVLMYDAKDAMTDALANYMTIGATTYTMQQAAYIMVHYPYASESGCTLGSISALSTDEEWNVFKGLYASAKQKILAVVEARYAILKFGYNECIGNNSFNAFKNNFYQTAYSGYTYWNSQYFNFEQPCSYWRSWVFAGKTQRFPGISNMLSVVSLDGKTCENLDPDNLFEPLNCPAKNAAVLAESKKLTESALFKQCGICPNAKKLETFLSAMLDPDRAANKLTSTGINLSCPGTTFPEYSAELANAMGFSNLASITYNYVSGSSDAQHLVVHFDPSSTCTLELKFPSITFGSASYGISDIVKICCLKYTATPALLTLAGNKNFTLTATVKLKSGDPDYTTLSPNRTREITIEGVTSCLELGNCFAAGPLIDGVCGPNEVAFDLINFLNATLAKGDFLGTANSTDTPYPGFATPRLTNLFQGLYGGSGDFTWDEGTHGGTSLTADIISNGTHCTFAFTLPSGYTATQITKFVSIKQYATGDYRTFTITAFVAGSPGVYIDILVSQNCFDVISCVDVPNSFTNGGKENSSLTCLPSTELLLFEEFINDDMPSSSPVGYDENGHDCNVPLSFIADPETDSYNTFAHIASYTNVQPDPDYATVAGPNSHFLITAIMANGSTVLMRGNTNGCFSVADCSTRSQACDADVDTLAPIFPIKKGVAVVSFYEGEGAGDLFNIVDVRKPALRGAPHPASSLWSANMYCDPRWTYSALGTRVFGLATDNSDYPNIYAASTPVYGSGGQDGRIFRVNGITGDVDTLAILPNTGQGLGNICFDAVHNQFFVSNFEDGKIYRLDHSGNTLSTFDPFTADGNTSGFAPLGERVWAVKTHNSRLYFSVWNNDIATADDSYNKVYSVALDKVTGNFVGAETLEITLPYFPSNASPYGSSGHHYSSPVADMTFTQDGKLVLTERVMTGNASSCAHEARVLKYELGGTTWAASSDLYFVNNVSPNATCGSFSTTGVNASNAAGGVTHAFDGSIIATGDYLGVSASPAHYGLSIMPALGNTLSTAESKNYVIDLGVGKTQMGDVEIAGSCDFQVNVPLMCDLPDFPVIEVDDSLCIKEQIAVAGMNAKTKYDDYIAAVAKQFRENYIKKCLTATETFTMSYPDAQHHFTLYYYDQAGNLVRTIPPQGVVNLTDPLPAESLSVTTARITAAYAQIKNDRANGTRTYFTKHSYATTYLYNSLNQLVAQSMPDHVDQDIWSSTPQTDPTKLIPSSHTVNTTVFSTVLNGFAFTTDGSGNSHIFKTTDGGATWEEMTQIGTMKLNDVAFAGMTVFEAIVAGNDGTILKSDDGGAHWNTMPFPSTNDIIRIHIFDVTTTTYSMHVYDKAGHTWESTDGGTTWTAITSTSTTLNTVIGSATLTDVSFYDDDHGIAVTDAGDIFYTDDLYVTWTKVTDKHTTENLLCIANPGSIVKAIAGVKAVQLTTSDYTGFTRTAQESSAVVLDEIQKIYYVSALNGFALAKVSTNIGLYKTIDGGKTWAAVTDASINSVTDFVDMFFINTSSGGNGFAVTAVGTVCVCTNGTWSKHTTTGISDIKTCHFENSNVGYIAGTNTSALNKKVYKVTLSGGTPTWSVSWTALACSELSTSDLMSGVFSSGTLVVLLTNDGTNTTVYKSTNTGGSFGTSTGFSTRVYTSMKFTGTSNGYISSADGYIQSTTSGGTTWTTSTTQVISSSTVKAFSAYLNGSDTYGVVVTDAGGVFTTTAVTSTGTWLDKRTKINAGTLNGVYRNTSSTAYAVGNNGNILKTDGSISSWQVLQLGADKSTAKDLHDVTLNPASGVPSVIVGKSGVRYTFDVSTGIAAAPTTSTYTVSLNDATVTGSTSTAAFVAGDQGTTLKYNSGTSTWSAVTLPAEITGNLNAVDVYPATTPTNAIVVGNDGKIAYTTDLSAWSTPAPLEVPTIYASQMATSTVGFAVGKNGVILSTTDGGASWAYMSSGVTTDLNALYMFDANNGFAVGKSSVLLQYTNTGTPAWTRVTSSGMSSTGVDFNDIHFSPTADLGIIVGSGGSGFVMVDHNGTWTTITPGTGSGNTQTTAALYAVYVVDKTFAYTVGAGGVTVKLTNTSTTNTAANLIWALKQNGGVNWTTNDLHDVAFKDYVTGVTIGNAGTILKSVTGGDTWIDKSLTPTTTENLTHFSNLTTNDYVVSGANGTVYKVNDRADLYSSFFWYDELGRLVVSQNSKQFSKLYGGIGGINDHQTYSYTRYDERGRIIEVGEVHGLDPVEKHLVNGQLPNAAFEAWVLNGGSTRSEVTKTVYDNADPSVSIPGFTQENLRNRVASAYIYRGLLIDGYTAATHYSYDIHGNVKTLIQEIPDMVLAASGFDHQYNRIDYDYDLVSGNVNTVKYQDGKIDAFYHYYEYDADNRITNVYTNTNQSPSGPDSPPIGGVGGGEHEAKYFYYDHGPLARTETGDNKVHGADYIYTIQGWIKNVNSNTLDATLDVGKDGRNGTAINNDYVARDAYGYSLNYFFDDYKSISGVQTFIASLTANGNVPQDNTAGSSSSYAKNLFNGNINSMVTAMVDASNISTNTPSPQLTAYKYDQLNRITGMKAYRDIASNAWGNASTYDQSYETEMSYDKNGNIMGMLRNGIASTDIQMDSLSYKYENIANGYTKNTNRLRYVKDKSSYSSHYATDIDSENANNYIYDEIGNLVADKSDGTFFPAASTESGLDEMGIDWTVYGKVKSVAKSSDKVIEFFYDAAGNRIRKKVTPISPDASEENTFYVRDASGNVMATYTKSNAEITSSTDFRLNEQYIYGSSRVGLFVPEKLLATRTAITDFDPDLITHTTGLKQYELSNHLGNVLTTVSDRRTGVDAGTPDGTIDYFTANITSVTDYGVWGDQLPGRNANSGDYKYGFNGKEKDDEWKTNGASYDYGFRIYDPRLGRFLSVDPLFQSYPWYTPYQFAGNKPIWAIDLDGLEEFKKTLVTNPSGSVTTKIARKKNPNEEEKGMFQFEDRDWVKVETITNKLDLMLLGSLNKRPRNFTEIVSTTPLKPKTAEEVKEERPKPTTEQKVKHKTTSPIVKEEITPDPKPKPEPDPKPVFKSFTSELNINVDFDQDSPDFDGSVTAWGSDPLDVDLAPTIEILRRNPQNNVHIVVSTAYTGPDAKSNNFGSAKKLLEARKAAVMTEFKRIAPDLKAGQVIVTVAPSSYNSNVGFKGTVTEFKKEK